MFIREKTDVHRCVKKLCYFRVFKGLNPTVLQGFGQIKFPIVAVRSNVPFQHPLKVQKTSGFATFLAGIEILLIGIKKI